MPKQRVVITGMGVISPVGHGLEPFWEGITKGESGVGPVMSFDATDYPTRIAAHVKDFDPLKYVERKDARHMDRFVQLAIAAAEDAMNDADLLNQSFDSDRFGVSVGTGIGGMETLSEQFQTLMTRGPSRISPFFIPKMIANIAGGQIAMRYQLSGPNVTLVTACASSGNAIGEALRAIQFGEADIMLTGGTEAVILPISFAGFSAMKAMSTRNDDPLHASRPFDKGRDGFVMGEGAGFLVLESLEHATARGARVHGELVGYGRSADAYHMVEPHPQGKGARLAMVNAIRDAEMSVADIDYINAHGTSTPKGDAVETSAIKQVFGSRSVDLLVSSTKSSTGHLLGAAGAVEAIASTLAIHKQMAPPTINLEESSADCDLNYVPNVPQSHRIRTVMSNAFGFGGQNASLIIREFESHGS